MLADKIRYYQEEKKMLKNTPAGYKKRISMAERGGFSCAGECTVKSGRGLSGNFSGNREWDFRIINQKNIRGNPIQRIW